MCQSNYPIWSQLFAWILAYLSLGRTPRINCLSFSTLQAEWSERLVRLCKDNELENSGKPTNLLSRQSGVNA